MDLYNDNITEFVNWINGEDVNIPGQSATNNKQPSGLAIRNLLQEHLRKPIYVFKDTTRYRIFSSEAAYNLWKAGKEGRAPFAGWENLQIAELPKQSEYDLKCEIVNADLRYVIKGDDKQTGSTITYSWEIKQGETILSDEIRATYEIKNLATNKVHTQTERISRSEKTITRDFYKYLDEGENTVTLKLSAINYEAEASPSVSITMINFNIDADFEYTSDKISQAEFNVNNVVVNLNTRPNSGFTIYYVLDGKWTLNDETDHYDSTQLSVENQFVVMKRQFLGMTSVQGVRLKDLLTQSTSETPIYHTLQIYCRISQNNTVFTSNILFYTFEVRKDFNGEDTPSIANHFVNFKASINASEVADLPILGLPTLSAVQYDPYKLEWGYYSDNNNQGDINVSWELQQTLGDTVVLTTGVGISRFKEAKNPLSFMPSLYTQNKKPIYLVAKIDGQQIISIPMKIEKGNSVYETASYELKLTAYGRENIGSGVNTWTYGRYSTEFTGFKWDNINGWDAQNGALRTYGPDSYAIINCSPLADYTRGKTIEIEFESEKINNDQDVLIRIGSDYQARIDITPNSAILYDTGGEERIKTNFKTNERLKLHFIINPRSNNEKSELIFIVNNGILERGISSSSFSFETTGPIKIGGSNSGVKVYTIRVYDFPLTYKEAYNNWVFDAENKQDIITRNDIYVSNKMSYDKCCGLLDTILITGDLSRLLDKDSKKKQSETDVTIQRTCPYDSSKDFICYNALIRKHGQSTLNYPIPSMKFWFNKSTRKNVTPELHCVGQEACKFNKNRYRLRDEEISADGRTVIRKASIPSNKFVLQANYADSSGVHNGGLQRLIQQTWYNAEFNVNGKVDFRLRTAPQLFTTNEVISNVDKNLNEDKDPNNNNSIGVNWRGTYDNKLWKDTFVNNETGLNERPTAFPYDIQIAPDSIPVVVFYKDTSADNKETFLGSYVLMEDKKADFVFGERSIYNFPLPANREASDYPNDPYDEKDPFVLKKINTKNGSNALIEGQKGQDHKSNRVWNNANVLRIEVLDVNTPFTSYMQYNDKEGNPFDATVFLKDEQGRITNERVFNWEQEFELIYPDPDDIKEEEGMDKFNEGSKYRETIQPFIDWFAWITSTYENQEEFEKTAAQHLDLYKLAAYYIYVLRFGLVDSLERNAQLKTYDGIHWHYEPWDMDIALGNKNTGGIAFNPPIDRNTTKATDRNEYAISGRQGDGMGGYKTSNWLWDALEAWPYWADTIVPAVAEALYTAGLTYENITKIFDEEYAGKWCESIYNDSGYFKYVLSGGGSNTWLNWLQGARTTHRHWWLSTSMNYYDAKWNCGDFRRHTIYVGAVKPAGNANQPEIIIIRPNAETYLTIEQNYQKIGSGATHCDHENPARFDITSLNLATKVPFHIYGATFIEELDISCLAKGMDTATFTGAYDNVLGPCIKVLNMGVPTMRTPGTNVLTGYVNGNTLQLDFGALEGKNVLGIVKEINIVGLTQLSDMSIIHTNNLTELQNFYAKGTGITSFESAEDGNQFEMLELPAYNTRSDMADGDDGKGFKTLILHDSTWSDIIFWDAAISAADNSVTYTKHQNNSRQSLNIPYSLNSIKMTGKTASSENAQLLVLNWIDSIRGYIVEHSNTTLKDKIILIKNQNNLTGDDSTDKAIEILLRQELNQRTLEMEYVEWTQDNCASLLTYEQLSLIAEFNNKNNNGLDNKPKPITGYVQLSKQKKLTAEQLTNIKHWFGENTFNKVARESNLVVDQPLDYVQINFGEGGDPGDITIKDPSTQQVYNAARDRLRSYYTQQNDRAALNKLNNELKTSGIFIAEGKKVTVSATRFTLQETEVDAQWYFIDPQTGSQSINKGSFRTVNFMQDETGKLYINVAESSGGKDFDVLLLCTLNGESSYILIHILAVSYPEKWDILTASNELRQYNGGFVFHSDTLPAIEFYLDLEYPFAEAEGNTKPNGVTWTLKNPAGQVILSSSYTTFKENPNNDTTIKIRQDSYFSYAQNASHEYPIILKVTGTIPKTGMIDYVLTCTFTFKSGDWKEISKHIVLMDDAYPIYTNNSSAMWDALCESYLDSTGSQITNTISTAGFYKSDLLSLTMFKAKTHTGITTTLANGTKYGSSGDVMRDDIQFTSIFQYLPNVEEIDLSNCIGLTTFTKRTYNQEQVDYPNIVFGEMKKLKKLNLSGCNKLGFEEDPENNRLDEKYKTIDLSSTGANTNVIEYVNLTNTYMNVKFNEGTEIQQLFYGTPSAISIVNQPKLDAQYVQITSSSDISELTISTTDNTKTGMFSLFDKVIKLSEI